MNFLSIEQENEAANTAFDVLKLQPGWANVQERLATANVRHSRLAEELQDLRSRRCEALRHFTLQAITYLDLVKDSVTADAFCNLLPLFVREAFTFSCGLPPQCMRPVSGDEKEFERKIEFRFRRWTAKAYQRAQLQSAKSNTFSGELAEDQSRKLPTRTIGHRGQQPWGPDFWRSFNLERTSKTSEFRDHLVQKFVSLSLPRDCTNRKIIEQIASRAEIPVGSLCPELDNPVHSRGVVVHGFAGDELDRYASEYANVQWWISDNGLIMATVPMLPARISTFDDLVSDATSQITANDLAEPHAQVGNESSPVPSSSQKGDIGILHQVDGQFKRAVTLDAASRYAGVTIRAIQQAAQRGDLKTEGTRTRRRVLVKSLLKYCPPEK